MLHISGLSSSIKRHSLVEWIKKQKSIFLLPITNILPYRIGTTLRVKGQKILSKWHEKIIRCCYLISD